MVIVAIVKRICDIDDYRSCSVCCTYHSLLLLHRQKRRPAPPVLHPVEHDTEIGRNLA